MKFRLFIGLTVLLWPLCGPAQTTGTTGNDAEPVQFYDVEVVIFKNLSVPKSREYVLPVSSPRKDEIVFDISAPQNSTAAAALGYALLPTSEYRLVEQVARLVESSRYELLCYVAWRQPGLELGAAIPVWITGGKRYGIEYTSIDDQLEYTAVNQPPGDAEASESQFEFDEQSLEALELKMLERQEAGQHQGLYELEGKITVTLSRYLHTYTDLVLRRPRRSADAVPTTASQDLILSTYAADTRILNNHSLKEHRRMRSKNLHYLDNPEFSMLILITPSAAPGDSAQGSVVQ